MYRVVNAAVIFEVLWQLLSFGHRELLATVRQLTAAEGFPVPGRDSPIDSVQDFFRVRLACVILDACGSCFSKGSLRRRLDHYLVVLQVGSLTFSLC